MQPLIQRLQILDALYGLEPDPTDPALKRIGLTGNQADKDRFLRKILGKKVVAHLATSIARSPHFPIAINLVNLVISEASGLLFPNC